MNPPRSLADDRGSSPPPPPPHLDYPPSGSPPPSSSGIIAGTVVGSVVILLLALWMVFFIWRSKRSKSRSSGSDNDKDNLSLQPQPTTAGHEEVGRWPQHNRHEIVPLRPTISSTIQSSSLNTTSLAESDRQYLVVAPLSSSPTTFTYEELKLATDGFSESNFLGQGGFGTVHKGVLPYTGQSVAIKQLRSESKQGVREFQTEVQVISRVHHRHLVSLVGYSISESHRTLMLVYEFVPNKSLDFHLHGKSTRTIDWATRMKIAVGSAKGLAYLHEDCQPKIIHRDIKAANILLDNDFEPKVADFGLARFSSDTETHVSTRIVGTFGYLAPEYAASGKLTEKSDVFSFGVVLLELITGRRPAYKTEYFTDDNMVEWNLQAIPLLWEAMENRNFEELADVRLENDYDIEGMFRMVSCAAHCIRHSAKRRPRMSQVVQALLGNICLEDLNDEQSMTPRRQFRKDSDKLSKREAFESLLGYNTSPYDYKHQFTSSSSGSKI